MHPEPEDSRETVGEPADEEGGDEAEETVEDGDGFGDDHGDGPGGEGDAEPDKGGELGPADQVLAVLEDSGEDVGGGDVTVNDTSNYDGYL